MVAKRDRSWLHEHALGLALAAMFLGSMLGLAATGRLATNEQRVEHGLAPLSMREYLTTPDFVSATFENWESEFLQMGVFVLLTVWLREKGSSESRPLDPAEEKKPKFPVAQQPRWARAGGIVRRLYENSLSLALFALFAVSFVLHFLGSLRLYNDGQAMHGQPAVTAGEYALHPQFWFESFQNWQSEFVSVLAIVMLSVWLRQKDSPQSKPVEAPHSHTGH
jgi:hypothetical protein